MNLKFTAVTPDDLDIVTEYETASYHPEEAASREQLARRIHYAAESGPELFTVARDMDQNGKVVGFLCTTLTTADLVTDESMSRHEPNGRTVCLHSVCVSPDYRNQGIATKLLENWIEQLKQANQQAKKYDRVVLMSRPNLLGLYGGVGFKEVGVSKVVHGPEPWHDCVLELQ
ncbi:acyl-CoA N-acyltransferase [Gilbertella persicaria]|uniref:acyl-CoA N-acyltransferase n=1 Tax=Gilbertella persicaria TaxID=101096 RepID=UPI00222019C0|nr:acyl-CoA N-acyltransferase [Gilbertella persicaria]KAI8082623.1 acyl-CoA N-acyltransferase [Gilbertella persicaria]